MVLTKTEFLSILHIKFTWSSNFILIQLPIVGIWCWELGKKMDMEVHDQCQMQHKAFTITRRVAFKLTSLQPFYESF